MSWLRYVQARLRGLWRSEAIHREIDEEMRFHIQETTEENIALGMSPEEARREAERRFGRLTELKERGHDVRGGRWLGALWQDVRYGLRTMRKAPVFTAVTVLTLALGIGANTAIFSLLDALLLESLPVPQPERLVLFGNGQDTGATDNFPDRSWDLYSYPFYRDVRRDNDVFADVAAVLSIQWGVHGAINTPGSSGELERMDVLLVSGTYFSVLGVNAELGRTFTEADDLTPGGHPIAVVSHALWVRRLGADPAAIGRTITIDQTTYTIVGVAPKAFLGTTALEAPDVWVPLAMEPQLPPAHWNGRSDREAQSLYIIGRLKDGVSVEHASAAVNLLFKQSLQEQAGPAPSAERAEDIERARIELTPAGKGISGLRNKFSLSLQILMAAVGVVLLIACANVANLLLARASARQPEFAVRLALGAGRLRLVRQLLTESVLLAALGAVVGVALAWWGSRLLVLMASTGSEPLPLDVTPSLRVLGFTLLASLLAAAFFGTAPALRASRIEPNATLRGSKGSARAEHGVLGRALVVVQVALSLLLLVGAGLFVRTLVNLQNVPSGFDQENVLLFETDVTTTGLEDERLGGLLDDVEERVAAEPGVRAVAFAFVVFNQGQWTSSVFVDDPAPSEAQGTEVRQNVVGDDFFSALGVSLLAGRGFGPQDTTGSPRVAVVSEAMARRFFPNGSALGRRFATGSPESDESAEIVGIVRDARYGSLTEQMRPMIFYSHAQRPQPLGSLVVRFSGEPEQVVPRIRQAIKEVDRNLPVDGVVSLTDHIDRSLVRQKLVARLASFFGLLALTLACVGLYGVLSYAIARRTREIGVRMALGARRGDVLRLVVREASTLVLVGVAIGLAASLAVTRAASSLLFELQPNDPLTIALATSLLVAVALVACLLPARRATKIDPMLALRAE